MCEQITSFTSILLLFHSWLKHLMQILDTDSLHGNETVSWAAYHAIHQAETLEDGDLVLSSLLPLFHEQAKSVMMIRHSMDVVKTAVEIINPGQVLVMTCDQPLYATCKTNPEELASNSWRTTVCCDLVACILRWQLSKHLEIF